jgi:hypothetical protein
MTRAPALKGVFVAALWLAPAAAWGDEAPEPAPVEIESPSGAATQLLPAPPVPGESSEAAYTGRAAVRDWQQRRRWRYGTQNLFPLTRGMEEAGIPKGVRWALHPFTVAFDAGNAVFGAIGGLYGD